MSKTPLSERIRSGMSSLRAHFRAGREAGFTFLELVVTVAIIIIISVGGFLVSSMIVGKAREEAREAAAESNDETPQPSAPAVDTPAVDGPPADFTGLWVTLGAIGGVLLIAALGVLLFSAIKRNRHASLELQEKQAAISEDRRKALAIWQRSVDKHGELKDKVIEIETDWNLLFSYPALVDPTVPQTREFHRALRVADNLTSEAPADLSLAVAINELPYPTAVGAADETWRAAWSFAQRTGTKLIPKDERKKIDQIVQLLKLARDGGGSEHERSVAYDRATKLIGELSFVKIPEAALKAIDMEARQMIEAGSPVEESSEREPVVLAVSGR